MTARMPSRIKEVDVDLNMKGIPFACLKRTTSSGKSEALVSSRRRDGHACWPTSAAYGAIAAGWRAGLAGVTAAGDRIVVIHPVAAELPWSGEPQDARRDGDGASRPRPRARSTASVRPCAPSLAKRWRTCVRTVCTDRDSSRAISGADKLVGR
jgi:hypothetical protein